LTPLREKLKDDGFAKAHVLKDVDNSKIWHDRFVETIEARHLSYRGVLKKNSEPAKWTSKLHPPYLFQVLETIAANLIDDDIKAQVKPRVHPDSTPAEHQQLLLGAEAIEAALNYENELDHLSEKQRPIALEACIIGIAVGKLYWDYRTSAITTQQQVLEAVHDEVGNVLGHIPVWKDVQQNTVLRDGPCFDPVDMRDFFWDESATSIERARWCCHRVWMTLDELLHMQDLGVYSGVEDLSDNEEIQKQTEQSTEDTLLHRNRTKGLYEVLEYWTNDRVVVVADRKVLLRNDPNPFDHGMKPFVEFSTMPQPYQVGGTSDVELVKHLQDAAWLMLNQRIDNVNLLNNAIILMRSDVDDPDNYEFEPGARWLVDDIAQVTVLPMNDAPAQVSLDSEKLIKGDIMDITGGMPFTSGVPDSTESNTATGASIYQTVAQRRLAARKQQLKYSWRRVMQMKLELLQQFITEARLVPIIGKGGTKDFLTVLPEQLQGSFDASIDPVSDSFMRQEKRAEAQAMFQAAVQAAPAMAASGAPLNMGKFTEHWLEQYGITDPESYMLPAAQAQAGIAPPPGAQPGANMGGTAPTPENAIPPLQGQPGVTNPALAAGPMSPSSATSISPVAAIQQSLASGNGGGRSA
jgi:hypothetical protein